jgi:hypothetical protein
MASIIEDLRFIPLPSLSAMHSDCISRMGRREQKHNDLWAKRNELTKDLVAMLTDIEPDSNEHDRCILRMLNLLRKNIRSMLKNFKSYRNLKHMRQDIETVFGELDVNP